MKVDIIADLKENSYPGRGIIIGKTADSEYGVIAYFIMGRSENSRNRIFDPIELGIRTKAYDEAKLTDPSLIIYNPVLTCDDKIIVTNGDQTNTIYDSISNGGCFKKALKTRTFEPDAPNYTPRISGMMNKKTGKYQLSILKSNNGNPDSVLRFFYEYTPVAGQGHFIHTYKCDGEIIPSFDGEPKSIEIKGDIDSFTNDIWNNLNEENKVSLYTNFINMKTGEYTTRIINKFGDK